MKFKSNKILFILDIVCSIGFLGCGITAACLGETNKPMSDLFRYIALAFLGLLLVLYAIHKVLGKRQRNSEAQYHMKDLHGEDCKYVFFEYLPKYKGVPRANKRDYIVTLYREVDEALLLESLLVKDGLSTEDHHTYDSIEQAEICSIHLTITELLAIKGKTFVADEDESAYLKFNSLYAELVQNNRIITYQYK